MPTTRLPVSTYGYHVYISTKNDDMPPLNITGVDGATMTMTATRDTSTNAPSILTFNVIFCGITLLVVGARFYVKTAMLKTAGTDDFLMAAATICGFGVFICMIGETKHGIGMHTASSLPDEYTKMIHWRFFHSIIVTLAIALVKLSVAVFLLRLVPGRKYKFFLYGMIGQQSSYVTFHK